jgi:hypothetical protein
VQKPPKWDCREYGDTLMIANNIEKLCSVAKSASTKRPVHIKDDGSARLVDEINATLARSNGFHAFESALRFYPSDPSFGPNDINKWNSREVWIYSYGSMADHMFFFAEDIFGNQSTIKDDKVVTFDPETAKTEFLSSSLDQWAAEILDDYSVLTGYPAAHEWQVKMDHAPLATGYCRRCRLSWGATSVCRICTPARRWTG